MLCERQYLSTANTPSGSACPLEVALSPKARFLVRQIALLTKPLF